MSRKKFEKIHQKKACFAGRVWHYCDAMNAQQIIKQIGDRQAGGVASIVVNRPGKIRKKLAAEAGDIRKVSRFAVQIAGYAKRAPVKQAVASGEREAPQTPAWVESVETMPNGLRFWTGKNGKRYLAIPRFGESAKVEWKRNGETVPESDVAPFLLASETAKRPSRAETEAKGQAQFVAVTLDNIAEIS